MTEAPLKGIHVLDFMWVMAGPAATQYLSQYGATLVRVESASRIDTARTLQPFKDGQSGPERSGLYANLNYGKLNLALNVTNPAARPVLDRLVRWADVITESFSPKGMASMGMDYEACKKLNPGVIMLSSCLNGHYGPEAQLAGFGTMGAQLAGFGELAGWPDRAPAGPFGAYTDYIAPKFTVVALLAALEYRRRTGKGQYIDLSQAEASQQFLGPALLDYTVNGVVDSRAGNTSQEFAPHGVYPCRGEDDWVAIVCETEDQFAALATATGNATWATDPRFATHDGRLANRDTLDALLGEWTATRTRDEAESLLIAAGVPAHRVSGASDLATDPQLMHRGHFGKVSNAELGEVTVETSRMRLSRTPQVPLASTPTLGEHSQEVLSGMLGFSEDEIVELVAAGAIE